MPLKWYCSIDTDCSRYERKSLWIFQHIFVPPPTFVVTLFFLIFNEDDFDKFSLLKIY